MAVRTVAFGREAIQALRAAIDGAKAGDRCAAVTVAVGSVPCAVQLRRELVRGHAPEGPGLFGVRLATLSSLVRQLAPPCLNPCPQPVRWAVARRLLRDDPGPFRECAGHPDLPGALLRAFDALDASDAPSGPLEGLWRRYRAEMERFGLADPSALANAIPASIPDGLGRVVVFLPKRPSGIERTVLQSLEQAGAELILGATGDPAADGWLSEWSGGPPPACQVPAGDAILACTDPEQECREAVRRVWEHAQQGVPLERQAILFRRRDPYARVAFQVLREAGLPAYGRAYQRVSDSALGTLLSVALDFAEHGFDANRLFDWLGSHRARTDQGRAPDVSAWRRLVREIGVETNLEALLAGLGRLSSPDAAELASLLERWRQAAEDLFAATDPLPWSRRVSRLLEWVDELMPDATLPEAERRQKERWRARAIELESVEPVQQTVEGPEFAWFVRQTLRGAGRAPGRLGTGVFVGTFEEARGMDLDAVFLLGVVEGVCPTIVRGDPVLGLVPGALPPVEEQVARERELYLSALGSGARRVVLFPRVSRLDGSSWLPSRWIGDDLRSKGLDTEAYEDSPSFEARIRQGGFASPAEVDAACSIPHGRAEAWSVRCRERLSDQPGPHLGLVRPLPEILRKPRAVTEVGGLVACPQRFFLGSVLGVRETFPAADWRPVDPRRLGSAIHGAFADFFRSLSDRWPERWSDEHRDRLRSLVQGRLSDLERDGWIRRRGLWSYEAERLPELAVRLLEAEAEARGGAQPLEARVEVPFGAHGAGVKVGPPGEELFLQGRIDLLEVFEDRLLVVDLKTGGSRPDPIQVLLYLRALEATEPRKSLGGAYLLLQGNEDSVVPVPWDAETKESADQLLARLVRLVRAGWFPLTPSVGDDRESQCRYCPFDRLCPSDRIALQEAAMEHLGDILKEEPEDD